MIFDIAGGIQRPLPARSQSKERPTAEPRESHAEKMVERGVAETHPTPATRTQQRIVALPETSPELNYKRDTKLRYVDNPRGVSSNHVCKQAFGDASGKT